MLIKVSFPAVSSAKLTLYTKLVKVDTTGAPEPSITPLEFAANELTYL